MGYVIEELRLDNVDLVDKGANQAAFVQLWKRDSQGEGEANMPKDGAPTVEELQKALADEQAAKAKLEQDLADAAKQNATEVEKALTAEREARETLEKQLQAEVARREKNEAIDLVKTRYAHIAKADDLAEPVAIAKRTLDPKVWAAIDKALADASASYAKVFGELGHSDDGQPSVASGEGLGAIAKSLRDKDPTLSEARARILAADTPEGKALIKNSLTGEA